jgi:hypothetical protein
MASGGTGKNELSTNDTTPNSQVAYGLPAAATHQSYSLLSMGGLAYTVLGGVWSVVMAGVFWPSATLAKCSSHMRP